MAKRYVKTKPARFRVEREGALERIVIPVRRRWFLAAFIGLWLAMWTAISLVGLSQPVPRGSNSWPLALPVVVLPWLFFGPILLWAVAGKDVLRVNGGDLEIGQSLFGWTRWRTYRGSEISDLAPAARPAFWEQMSMEIPFLMKPRFGAVKFSYGARTVHAALGLDEAEGKLIVEWLVQRLPRTEARE